MTTWRWMDCVSKAQQSDDISCRLRLSAPASCMYHTLPLPFIAPHTQTYIYIYTIIHAHLHTVTRKSMKVTGTKHVMKAKRTQVSSKSPAVGHTDMLSLFLRRLWAMLLLGCPEVLWHFGSGSSVLNVTTGKHGKTCWFGGCQTPDNPMRVTPCDTCGVCLV